MRWFLPVVVVIMPMMAGCVSKELQYSTNSGASAVDAIYRQQALNNFAKLLEEPFSLPSQVYIQNGTMQTNTTFTPTFTFPLSNMFARLAGTAISTTTTTAGGGASLAGSQSYQLNYVVAPMADILGLYNVRAIYMAAIYNAVVHRDGCSDGASFTDRCKEQPAVQFSLLREYMPPRVFESPSNYLGLDPYFLEPPLCILCLNDQIPFSSVATKLIDSTRPGLFPQYLHVNPLFTKAWLYWTGRNGPISQNPPPRDALLIGSAGGYEFFTTDEHRFSDFMLAVTPLPSSQSRFVPTYAPVKIMTGSDNKHIRPTSKSALLEQFMDLQSTKSVPGSNETGAQEKNVPGSRTLSNPP